MNSRKFYLALVNLIVAALLLGACGTPTAAPTVVPPTATATAIPPTATHTAIPPTNTPVPPTATPEPTATPDMTATAEGIATATATAAIAQINEELKEYGLTTDGGYLGWMQDSMTIKVDTYMEQKQQTNYPDMNIADFVLQADMTWETSTGLAGCGFVFRSESNLDRGKQYRVYIVRLQNLPLWGLAYFNHGEGTPLTDEIFTSTSALDTSQGSTNRITIIALGNKLSVYANGDQLGPFNHDKASQGIVAYMAFQESGKTTCTFTDSWLWVLKGEA